MNSSNDYQKADNKQSAVVFGASGYIGSHVAAQLSLAGLRVVAPVRGHSAFLQRLGVEQRLTDFHADAGLAAAIVPGSVVYCCLANPRRHLPLEALRRVEVELTGRVVRAAAQAGARRVVLLSTVMVYGFDRPSWPIDEDFPPAPRHPFCRVALEREQHAGQMAEAQGIECLILRPATAIGARDRQMMKLIHSFQRGVFPLIGDKDYCFSAMDARDIGRAMHWLGQRPFELRRATSGRVWLAKGFDTSWQEIRQTLEMLSGCSARVLRLPLPVAQGLGSLVERVCPYAWEPALTRFSVDTMSTDTLFDTRRLSDAGFMPTYALADALSDALGLL